MNKKIQGNETVPRLYVFKSNKHIYAQLINDTDKRILASSSSISRKIKTSSKSTTCDTARMIGNDLAIQSKKKGINKIVFDRGKKQYHGQIKALAESARAAGLIF
uniref:Large ribosomal subunit protein uL18c n=1 Tax=Grateloupia turuturu TaxID=118375 RepID=A0A6B9P497_9FLOR|nr:50S ribosomal protein L18 [Grateloupia turuturu]QHD45289.1 50S ribosomal protein L18 [Grateloupia turuturu]UXC96833.1 50S ribosomal protein L18 [Grateloupia turuturu]